MGVEIFNSATFLHTSKAGESGAIVPQDVVEAATKQCRNINSGSMRGFFQLFPLQVIDPEGNNMLFRMISCSSHDYPLQIEHVRADRP